MGCLASDLAFDGKQPRDWALARSAEESPSQPTELWEIIVVLNHSFGVVCYTATDMINLEMTAWNP